MMVIRHLIWLRPLPTCYFGASLKLLPWKQFFSEPIQAILKPIHSPMILGYTSTKLVILKVSGLFMVEFDIFVIVFDV